MIRATAFSDCRQIEREFDATPWAEEASDQAIINLINCKFKNDYPADDVALFMAEQDPNVAELFKFLEMVPLQPYSNETNGFECQVNRCDFLDWLQKHRPNLMPTDDEDEDE